MRIFSEAQDKSRGVGGSSVQSLQAPARAQM